MKKLFAALMVLVVSILISNGAWALIVNDQEGISGTYYGGIYTDRTSGSPVQTPTYAHDTIPQAGQDGADNWSITGFTANKVGSYIVVTFSGPYFATQFANPTITTTYGKPGDLYISSTGWRVSTDIGSTGHGIGDTFNMATEGWNYVVSYGQTLFSHANGSLKWIYNAALYNLTSSYTPTENVYNEYRTDEAWQGGYGTPVAVTVNATATLDMEAQTLTFAFDALNWNPDTLGYHWTQGCGNDVVEGGAVPEPGSLLLLGLGLAGIGAYMRKARRG